MSEVKTYYLVHAREPKGQGVKRLTFETKALAQQCVKEYERRGGKARYLGKYLEDDNGVAYVGQD